MDLIKERISAKLPEIRERMNRIKRDYNDFKVCDVTVDQIYSGIRGVMVQVSDVSYVDPNEGIRLRGYTVPETLELLPKQPGSQLPMAGGLYYLLMVDEMPTYAEASALEAEWRSLASVDEGLERLPLVQQGRALRAAEWLAEVAETQRLTLTAPFDGRLVDLDPQLQPGTWVHPRQAIGQLIGQGPWLAEAFVTQDALSRLRPGSSARYYPHHRPGTVWSATVLDIEQTRLAQLPHPMLAAAHGGPLPTLGTTSHADSLPPRDSLYRVRLALKGPPPAQVGWGRVALEAEPRSWLLEQLKPVAIVLIRELSF